MAVFFVILCAASVLYLSKSILVPFLLAALLAYAFDPLIDTLENKGLARSASICLIFTLIVVALFLILFFVLPTLQDQLTKTFKQLPAYLTQLRQEVVPAIENRFGVRFPQTFEETLEPILERLKNEAPALFKPVTTFALNFFTNTFGVLTALANLVIIPFMFFYLLRDFDHIKDRLTGYIPLKYRDEAFKRFREIDVSLSGFIRGQLLVILILSVLYIVGLTWIGIDLSFPLGLIAAAGEIVPYVGFAFGLILSLAFALLQFQDFLHPFYILLLFGGVQTIQGLTIAPWVMGKEVGLHPLVIVAAVYIGGDLFGLIGVLLAVPGAAILIVLLKALAEYYKNSSFYHETR
ncbi:MAG: AI-2E family transporter [Nitrospiria bacterium]